MLSKEDSLSLTRYNLRFRPESFNITESAQNWVKKPFNEWPTILLTNRANFKNDNTIYGASAYIVNYKGQQYACTASHLLDFPFTEVNHSIKDWRLHPRTKQDIYVSAVKCLNRDFVDTTLRSFVTDFMVLELKSQKLPKGLASLSLGNTPKVGDTLTLIGCQYADSGCVQKRYIVKVTEVDEELYIKTTGVPGVQLNGFSGAPLINKLGNVVGHLRDGDDKSLSISPTSDIPGLIGR